MGRDGTGMSWVKKEGSYFLEPSWGGVHAWMDDVDEKLWMEWTIDEEG